MLGSIDCRAVWDYLQQWGDRKCSACGRSNCEFFKLHQGLAPINSSDLATTSKAARGLATRLTFARSISRRFGSARRAVILWPRVATLFTLMAAPLSSKKSL